LSQGRLLLWVLLGIAATYAIAASSEEPSSDRSQARVIAVAVVPDGVVGLTVEPVSYCDRSERLAVFAGKKAALGCWRPSGSDSIVIRWLQSEGSVMSGKTSVMGARAFDPPGVKRVEV
jgi:hypothetical protein